MVQSKRKSDKRGSSVMADLHKYRESHGVRTLPLDSMGCPRGPLGKKFISLIGHIARKLPITVKRWKEHNPETVEKSWEELLTFFSWNLNRYSRKTVMQSMTKSWTNFKSYLGTKFADKGLPLPEETYEYISSEDWEIFCENRNTPKFQKASQIAKMVANSSNRLPHKSGRMGMKRVANEIKEKLYDLRKENELAGEETNNLSLDDIPEPNRVEKFGARNRLEKGFTNDEVREKCERVLEIHEQHQQRLWAPKHPREDALTTVLRLGHNGRVRGMGKGFGIKDAFPNTSSRICFTLEQLTQIIDQRFRDYENSPLHPRTHPTPFSHSPRSPPRDTQNEETRPSSSYPRPHLTSSSSHSPRSLLSDNQNGDLPCDLFVTFAGLRVEVAKGVMTSSKLLYGQHLAEDLVRVRIDEIFEPMAVLPCRTDKMTFVSQVKGTYVAWPSAMCDARVGADDHMDC